MTKNLLLLFLLFSIKANADTIPTYTKKYCLAFNTSYTHKYSDVNVYAYVSIYSKKHDYWVYVNYFNRTSNIFNDYSCGFFYDYMLTKKLFLWSYYQGEFEDNYTVHQISEGIGFYLLNKKNYYLGINNGFIYKNYITESNISEYRYNFRIKAEYFTKKFYIQTYDYFQPELHNTLNYNYVTFNTLTYRIRKNFNFKVYHWLSWNSIIQHPFQYIIFGFSIENW